MKWRGFDGRRKAAATAAFSEEAGFTLISVIIAFTILIVVLAPTAQLLQATAKISRSVHDRITAANLAAQQLESLGAAVTANFSQVIGASSSGGLLGTTTSSITVQGTPYTIAQTLRWTPGSYASGGCSNGGSNGVNAAPLLTAHESVVWPNMPTGSSPVVDDTQFAPPPLNQAESSGSLLFQVLNAAGVGDPNLTVQIAPTSGGPSTQATTDQNGCVYFPYLPSSSYTATMNPGAVIGQVTPQGASTQVLKDLVPSKGTPSPITESFDFPATLLIPLSPTIPEVFDFGLLVAAPGLSGTNTLDFPAFNSPYASGQGPQITRTSNSVSISGLFPFTSGYVVALGACDTYQNLATYSIIPSAVEPGNTTTGTLNQQIVPLTVTASGVVVTGGTVTDVQESTSDGTYVPTCSSSQSPITVVGSSTPTPTSVALPLGYQSLTGSYDGQSATPSTPLKTTTGGVGAPYAVSS